MEAFRIYSDEKKLTAKIHFIYTTGRGGKGKSRFAKNKQFNYSNSPKILYTNFDQQIK